MKPSNRLGRWKRGGGVVRVAAGEHETAPFVLRSNVTLELAEGAVLLASTNRADYPMPPGSKYFIFAEGASNVSIRGKGCIAGRGVVFREQEGLAGESQPQQLPVLMRFRVVATSGLKTLHIATAPPGAATSGTATASRCAA